MLDHRSHRIAAHRSHRSTQITSHHRNTTTTETRTSSPGHRSIADCPQMTSHHRNFRAISPSQYRVPLSPCHPERRRSARWRILKEQRVIFDSQRPACARDARTTIRPRSLFSLTLAIVVRASRPQRADEGLSLGASDSKGLPKKRSGPSRGARYLTFGNAGFSAMGMDARHRIRQPRRTVVV
jgi:hypothetical protein